MAVLDQFKLTNLAPKRDTSPVGRFRRRLIEALELQVELAKADQAGTQLNRTRPRRVKVGPNGERELRNVPVRLRRWWWKDDAGTTFVTLNYGSKPLEIAPGKKAIEIGKPEDLPSKLTLLCDAVRAGELDGCAKAATFGRGVIGKTKAAPTPGKGVKA